MDHLVNSIWSIFFAVDAGGSTVRHFFDLPAPGPPIFEYLGQAIIHGFLGNAILLLAAGILALVGRKAYLAWRREHPPDVAV